MIPTPCARLVFWHDVAMTTSCTLPLHHEGVLHSDGLRWFDADGLQAPQDPLPVATVRRSRCGFCGLDGFESVATHERYCAAKVSLGGAA